MKIIAIDPGITTGYCYAKLNEEDDLLKYYPAQRQDDVDDVWRALDLFQPRHIIIEDFEFRQRSRTGLILFSVQIIGVARLYSLMCKHQCAVHVQKASQGKGYYTNPVLKKLGLYRAGTSYEHAMDASRHLLQWYTFGYGYQFNNGQEKFAELVEERAISNG